MVNVKIAGRMIRPSVSVLALSSRFDGRSTSNWEHIHTLFQYSLCRVVLMVTGSQQTDPPCAFVSVLALSSRFDGPMEKIT